MIDCMLTTPTSASTSIKGLCMYVCIYICTASYAQVLLHALLHMDNIQYIHMLPIILMYPQPVPAELLLL